MPSVKFPININLESTDGDVDRAKIVNGYAEVASANEVKVYSRPALTLAQGSFAAFGQGLSLNPDGRLFVVSGGTYYFPVPSQSATQTGTFSGNPSASYLFRALGNSIYGFAINASNEVIRGSPPYTSFSSIGTHPLGAGLRSAQVYGGTMLLSGSSALLYKSVNGISWSTFANSQPSSLLTHVYALNGTLFAYQDTMADGGLYGYSTDFGATAWGTALTTASGIQIFRYTAGTFDNRLWALHGTGTDKGVAASTNGSVWTHVSTNPGWDQNLGGAFGNSFAVMDGVMYVSMVPLTTDYKVWASSDKGVTWSDVATVTSTGNTASSTRSMVHINNRLYGFLSNASDLYRNFSFLTDGALVGVTGIDTLDIPAGEIVSIISTEAGTTFIKSTTSAYTVTTGTATKVSDAQYPTLTVRGAVYLNGRLFVMEPDGTIWSSAEDDFTSWAGTDFVNAEFEADGGVCLAKQGEYVIALGQFTTEAFFFDGTITAGAPLSPVGSAVMLIGCAHANSVAQVESSLVWVAQQKGQGSTFHKGRFVVIMKGYGSYERISSPDVERVLDKDAFAEVYADILTVAGHVFYVLTLVDSDVTLAYDFRSQLWYDWTLLTAQSAQAITSITGASALATAILASHGYNDGDQVVVTGGTGTFTAANGTHNVNVVNSGTFTYPISSSFSGTCTTGTGQGWTSGALDISASCYFNNEQLVQLRETGDVYVLEGTGVSDNGAPIDFHIRTRNWDGGTNREKFMGSLDVVGDKVSSTGLVRYTDDDFQTYTRYKRVTLSLRRPRAKRGGSFSRRAVEFRHTLSAKVGISALEADIEMGEQ